MLGFSFVSASHPFLHSLSQSLSASRLADLQDFSGQLIVTAQHRPRCTIRFDEIKLQFRPHHLECRLLRVNGPEQGEIGRVPLRRRVGRLQVQIDGVGMELHFGGVFDNLLEEQRRNDGSWGLIEVMPANG
jgi:hypothetical protein